MKNNDINELKHILMDIYYALSSSNDTTNRYVAYDISRIVDLLERSQAENENDSRN